MKIIQDILFVLIVLLLIPFLCLAGDARQKTHPKPNILIIMIDTLRRDHVGIYGYHRETTPNIDRFAQKATVYHNAVSQSSWTNPSIASFLTSLYPSVHGVLSFANEGKEARADILNDEIVTLAEFLKSKGYSTGAFVANKWICERLGFGQGFDVFDSINSKFKPSAPEVNEKALQWIKRNKNKPFFAFLLYMDVHGPYKPPAPYDTFFKSTENRQMNDKEAASLRYLSVGRTKDKNNLNYYIDQYDGGIRYTDHHIGQLIDDLEADNILKNTFMVITADHGEAFFDHGFCNHGWSLYNEEIDVPLIIKFPNSIKAPASVKSGVMLIDIGSTIYNILDTHFPNSGAGMHSLVALNDNLLPHRAIFSEHLTPKRGHPKIALEKDNFKAIYLTKLKKVTKLYNIEKDPEEINNLIDIYPEKAKEYEKEIQSWQRDNIQERKKLVTEKASTTITEQTTLEQLRSLGYLN